MQEKKNKLKPLGKGSKPPTGNISDSALGRLEFTPPKDTLISWSKTDKDNWRYKMYWLMKSYAQEELEERYQKSKEFHNL